MTAFFTIQALWRWYKDDHAAKWAIDWCSRGRRDYKPSYCCFSWGLCLGTGQWGAFSLLMPSYIHPLTLSGRNTVSNLASVLPHMAQKITRYSILSIVLPLANAVPESNPRHLSETGAPSAQDTWEFLHPITSPSAPWPAATAQWLANRFRERITFPTPVLSLAKRN